jgi:hypothetical protein
VDVQGIELRAVILTQHAPCLLLMMLQVMYPAVRRLMPSKEHASVIDATILCTHEHEAETSLLEELGRLLADVRALVRRGRKVGTQQI